MTYEDVVDDTWPESKEKASVQFPKTRRGFLSSGLGGAAVLGAGVVGILASTALSTDVEASHTTKAITNHPDSTARNSIIPVNTNTIGLQVQKKFGSLQDVFNILEATSNDSLGTNKLISVNHKGHLIVWQGFDALRVRNTDGFREMHFRDASSVQIGNGEGRFAWLIADRLEPMQVSYIEHFQGGGLPPGWSENGGGSGPGTSSPLDNVPGGVRQITTAGSVNDWRNISLVTNTFSPQRDLHIEFYIAGLSSATDTLALLGLADAEVTNVSSLPNNMVYFYYNPNDSANWRAVVRTNGVFEHDVNSVVPVDAGKKFFRFECWPAGQVGFSNNTIKPYINGTEFGAPNFLSATASTPLPWTTLMRPFFFVQTLTGAARTLKVDAIKAWESEVWRY